jgi:succinate-semialdehyde dehydrogenase/glutarate-semialdehyde dehydrogenase
MPRIPSDFSRVTVDSRSYNAWIEYSPLGVLLGIQPWNYPYYQLARFAAPNLMAGNTLLVKHASGVPQCALAFEKILRDAGAPQGIYTNVFLGSEQVSALIDGQGADLLETRGWADRASGVIVV